MKTELNGKESGTKFYDYRRDGITQSLLTRFLECRQKAAYDLEGWTPRTTPASMTQGTIGHGVLQLVYEAHRTGELKGVPDEVYIKKTIKLVEEVWKKENPKVSKQMAQDLEMASLLVGAVLPEYFKFWKDDFKTIKWEKLEGSFKVPYSVKDGRKTFLKGKMDGVFKRKGLWLFESKFKGMINEGDIIDTLAIDLQVLLYLSVLRILHKQTPEGVLYNVVRRPGLKLGKAESLVKFAKRVREDVVGRPEWYFYRFEVSTSKKELEKWGVQLEGLVKDFMDWRDGKVATYNNPNSCVSKYGRCWGLTPCVSGDFFSLQKRKTVFRELEEV
jgi:hypothetical protein